MLKTPIRKIENHSERADARIARAYQMSAVRERSRVRRTVIRAGAAIVLITCAVYAIYQQF